MRHLLGSIVLLTSLLVVGCGSIPGVGSPDNASAQKNMSLYDRLGGQPAVTKVVEDFVSIAAVDPKVNFRRKEVPGAEWDASPENVAHLKQGLVDFLTTETGGPNAYKGKSMKDVHKNMQITEAQFDASVVDLKQALDKNLVPARLQKELLDIVDKTKGDIVTMK